jgi:CubicO group peptidase (beta-lactamase class C family)
MDGFREILTDAVTDWKIPGLSVAGFAGDESFSWAGGHADVKGGLEITDASLFPIASCTKPLTAAMVLEQVNSGAVALDQPLKDIVPEFRLMDPDATNEMTLRDVLCHRTGLPPHTWSWVYGSDTRKDFMYNRLPHLDPICGFKERHAYSNIMYAFAGYVLECLTGKPWELQVDPRFVHLDEQWFEQADVALPYRDGKRIPFFHAEKNHLIAPASELMSTASALSNWLFELDVLPMAQAQVNVSNRTSYGLGWRLTDTAQGREVWHSGQCSGYTAYMSTIPGIKAGIVLLSNQQNIVDELHTLAANFYARVLGGNPTLPAIKPPLKSFRDQAEPVPYNGELVAGMYENPGYGKLLVKEKQLFFQEVGPIDVKAGQGDTAIFELPIYGATFSMQQFADRIEIPFEPKVAPIVFKRI